MTDGVQSRMTVRGAWRPLAAASLLVVVAGSCASEAHEPPTTQGAQVATYTDPRVYRVGGSEVRRLIAELDPESPQRAILSDGHVTRSELDRAWVDYVQCMSGVGFTVTTSAWDPVTNTRRIYTYTPRADAGTSTTTTGGGITDHQVDQVDACEERHWFPVSAVYTADTRPHLTPDLAAAVVACMERRGYDVRGSTSFGDVVGAVRGQARGPRVEAGRDCLSEAMAHLYRDLPYFPRP
jgi:hypothetical protein